MSTTTLPPSYPVQVHHYPSATSPTRLVQTYEHLPSHGHEPQQQQRPPPPKNALVFIGGLGDGPHTVPYPRRLADRLAALPEPDRRYAVFEARLSSAFAGFGTASLAQDARELAALVRYLRGSARGARKVVLMGHSTGCQDCLAYAAAVREGGGAGAGAGEEGVGVDGLILQGPVSDREAIGMEEDAGEVRASLEVAEGLVKDGKGGVVMASEVMPAGWRNGPVTAYRWASLAGVG
jgi:pimeloyl-ACP methyl ester carboxylesterase